MWYQLTTNWLLSNDVPNPSCWQSMIQNDQRLYEFMNWILYKCLTKYILVILSSKDSHILCSIIVSMINSIQADKINNFLLAVIISRTIKNIVSSSVPI